MTSKWFKISVSHNSLDPWMSVIFLPALLEKEDIPTDPLKRTGCLFGGVYNDIRRRYPHYLSDIKDAANGQCIKTLFFIFFTCLSPCIAFGGLLSRFTSCLSCNYSGILLVCQSVSMLIYRWNLKQHWLVSIYCHWLDSTVYLVN